VPFLAIFRAGVSVTRREEGQSRVGGRVYSAVWRLAGDAPSDTNHSLGQAKSWQGPGNGRRSLRPGCGKVGIGGDGRWEIQGGQQ
jgi:hypothetical protein